MTKFDRFEHVLLFLSRKFGQNELLYDIFFVHARSPKELIFLVICCVFLAAMVPILFSWSSLLLPQRNWRGMRSLGPFWRYSITLIGKS